jgi:hypothetical protein
MDVWNPAPDNTQPVAHTPSETLHEFGDFLVWLVRGTHQPAPQPVMLSWAATPPTGERCTPLPAADPVRS